MLVWHGRDDDSRVIVRDGFDKPQKIREPSQNREFASSVVRRRGSRRDCVNDVTSDWISLSGRVAYGDGEYRLCQKAIARR
jgi:hypothetical protein